MGEATWAGLGFLVVSALIGGAKFLWNYVTGNYSKEIQSLKDKLDKKDDELTQSEATCDELRNQLHDCNDAKTSLTLTASRVEELHALTVLQGEKITALEGRVEKLSKLTEHLKIELEETSGRNDQLENRVRSQSDTISAYEKVFEILGLKLKENGSVERIAVE
jgi:chromosome segregation ATPase